MSSPYSVIAAWRKANPDKFREQRKRYREKHKRKGEVRAGPCVHLTEEEKLSRSQRAKARAKETKRLWYLANKSEIHQRQKAWRKINSERLKLNRQTRAKLDRTVVNDYPAFVKGAARLSRLLIFTQDVALLLRDTLPRPKCSPSG